MSKSKILFAIVILLAMAVGIYSPAIGGMIVLSLVVYLLNKKNKSKDDENIDRLIDKVLKETNEQRNQELITTIYKKIKEA